MTRRISHFHFVWVLLDPVPRPDVVEWFYSFFFVFFPPHSISSLYISLPTCILFFLVLFVLFLICSPQPEGLKHRRIHE